MIARITIFITGASIMILEILGVRMIASQLGTTIIVWSTMIGTIITSLAIGYYIGGILADRILSNLVRACIVFLAGVTIALIVPMRSVVFAMGISLPYGLRTLIVSTVLFALPTILLAMVSIYTLRMETKKISEIGSTNGTIYAISTIGSLVGVFLTSFYLIPTFSLSSILFIISSVLLLIGVVLGILYALSCKKTTLWGFQ